MAGSVVMDVANVSLGVWGQWTNCTAGYYVAGLDAKLYYDPTDQEGLTSLVIKCRAWALNLAPAFDEQYVNAEGRGNLAGLRQCPDNTFVSGLQVQIQEMQGVGDDTGAPSLNLWRVSPSPPPSPRAAFLSCSRQQRGFQLHRHV